MLLERVFNANLAQRSIFLEKWPLKINYAIYSTSKDSLPDLFSDKIGQLSGQMIFQCVSDTIAQSLINYYKNEHNFMALKRAQSYIVKDQTLNSIRNNNAQNPQREENSLAYISVNPRNRQRVPAMLQSLLRSKNSQTKSNKIGQEEPIMKQSNIGGVLRSKFKEAVSRIQDIGTCQICEGEILKAKNKNLQVYMCACDHKFSFCQSCLHHYTIYKVKNFEDVPCPHEGCPAFLDVETNFFKGLPVDVQKNYKKIHQFYLTSKDPDIRLCPSQSCQGVIKKSMDNVMVCNQCRKSFCGKCLFQVHNGECQNQQIRFFENNLHYRQCKKCKFVIEKNQGCNHMTCRCGHQFCYVCGEDWTAAHYGNHDENGKLIPVPDPERVAANYQNQECFDCGCFDTQNCLCNCCGRACGSVFKVLLRFLCFILFLMLMILIFLFRDFLIIIAMIVTAVFAGMFAFSCEILEELEGLVYLLAIIFFPVTMIFGIVKAFRQFFCESVSDACAQYCNMCCSGIRNICDW